MGDELGSLCLVLHAHLPYVLHHGTGPHGEAWLFEAAAETYLPLLDLIGECALLNVRPAVTIGLTPVLLEQLAHDRFKDGFVAYLRERIDRARQDRREFEQGNEPHLAYLAGRWEAWYGGALEQFGRIGRNIPGEFAARLREGHVQILTSNATHAYMPLLLTDQAMRAQMACGVATSARHLDARPTGMWLPECGYRPARDQWVPPVLHDRARARPGVEQVVAAAGVSHFVVDTHLVARGKPLGTWADGRFRPADEPLLFWDAGRGWGSPLELVGVASGPDAPAAVALARHPRASEQVWSGAVGYPGAGPYLDFHRRHGGPGGLRYHRVTGASVPQPDKHPYDPDATAAAVHGHAQHFCGVIRDALAGHRRLTGRRGVVVAPFDAELFGHWWFEGPRFLRDVILTLAHDPAVRLATAEEALARHPPDKVVRMPEGSWGERGDHSVWLNDKTRWMWEVEYRAEDRLLALLRDLPWRRDAGVRAMLARAARQLLLLQASDWPFVVHSGGAVDYGVQRFAGHATRFDRMARVADLLAHGVPPDAVARSEVAEADAHDDVFAEIDLDWWAAG